MNDSKEREFMYQSEAIARKERQYNKVIKYLNLAAIKQKNCHAHASDDVFLQQARELSYCKGVEQLNERDYLLFLDLAFFKALKALYPRELLIEEQGIFASMNLPFGQNFEHSDKLEREFDQASSASLARHELQSQCTALRAELKKIEAKAEQLQARSASEGSDADQAYQVFKQLSAEIHSHINTYEIKQNKQISQSGNLSQEIAAQCKEQCQGSIKSAAPVLSQHRGWGQILVKMLGAVRNLFLGCSKENATSLVFETQSAAKLNAFAKALDYQL
ncbi:MAG: hypothetical protein K0Q57_160 [Gammaproteobacteria bacterium]|nr:hypothetical protein [Gammaproteobacteria bacterium]